MTKIRRDSLLSLNLHRCGDLFLVLAGLGLAYWAKEAFRIGIPTEPLTPSAVLATVGLVGLAWLIVTSALETYTYKRKLFNDLVSLAAALMLTIVCFLAMVFFTRIFLFPRWLIVMWGLAAGGLLALARVGKLGAIRELHRLGRLLRPAIIVGTTDVARQLAEMFRREPALGYAFTGFVVTNGQTAGVEPVLGRIEDLPKILDEHPTREVIIALPGKEHEQVIEIAHLCQHHDVSLRVVPDLLEVVMARTSYTEVGNIPLIGLRDPGIRGYQSFAKRVFDIGVASFCLVLFSPVLVAVPILIRMTSGGKAVFVQRRAGMNGRPFFMYKFRSMIEGAEEQLESLIDLDQLDEPMYKIPDDPRVTAVGKFLRRTSIDELPQLLNVLKGDMSMVGPRPETLDMVARYSLENRRRLSVKPGITGPMQVSGRGDLSFEDRVSLELGYVARYSLFEDIKYILRTIPVVYHGRGAY